MADKSLKGVVAAAVAKGGITLSPTTDYDDDFQDLDALVDNMLVNRGQPEYTGEKSYSGYMDEVTTMSTCTCNTRIAVGADCPTRTACNCNGRTATCACNGRTLSCACNGRGYCDCVGRTCCVCQSRNGWPACPAYCGNHCHCNCRSGAACSCNVRSGCDCVSRGGCDCVSRTTCDCNTRTACLCNARTTEPADVYV